MDMKYLKTIDQLSIWSVREISTPTVQLYGAIIGFLVTQFYMTLGDRGSGSGAGRPLSGVQFPSFSIPNAEVSLGKILTPKLPLTAVPAVYESRYECECGGKSAL